MWGHTSPATRFSFLISRFSFPTNRLPAPYCPTYLRRLYARLYRTRVFPLSPNPRCPRSFVAMYRFRAREYRVLRSRRIARRLTLLATPLVPGRTPKSANFAVNPANFAGTKGPNPGTDPDVSVCPVFDRCSPQRRITSGAFHKPMSR